MKTFRTLLTFIFGMIALALMTTVVTTFTELPAMPVAVGLFAASFAFDLSPGLLFAGLNKEIWLPELMEGFYANDSFLVESRDFSAFVENSNLNLAEAGVNPDVLLNNTTYPIPINDRADLPISIPLHTFDTENQRVRHARKVELVYAKLQSIVFGHKQALRMTFMQMAAHSIAPAADTALTPVLKTTGAVKANGLTALTFDDIITLSEKFDEAEIPSEGRCLILSAEHMGDLKKEDIKAYKDMMKEGVLGEFKVYKLASKRLPMYNTFDDSKLAYGGVATATHVTASIAWQKNEVCRASSDFDMFQKEAKNNPEERADVIGFAMRGIFMPIRDKGVAAIFSPTA